MRTVDSTEYIGILEGKLDKADREITRLRSELSRAAVREVVTGGALRMLTRKLREIQEHPSFQGVFQMAQVHGMEYDGPSFGDDLDIAEAALADPFPLAEAAQEVLESAIKETEGEERDEKPAWIVRFRDDRADAVDRYRALLEGRKEG